MAELKSPVKAKVLEIVDRLGKPKTGDVAKEMGINTFHASKLLRTYWVEGLLKRDPEVMGQGGIRYRFYLTDSGRRRLNYFFKLKK